MSATEKQRVIELIEQPLRREGCELADLSLSRYKTSVMLKLYVYSVNPITLDECARISRIVGDVIDGTDMFERGYTLEVSSPGLSRPLTTAKDFKYRAGETVEISFADRSRKAVRAEIVSADEAAVVFCSDDETFTVPLAEIEKAKIVF